MTKQEYINRLLQLRAEINLLADDCGATYTTRGQVIENIINESLNGVDGDGRKCVKWIFGK